MIAARRLTKAYGEVLAVDNLSFDVPAGQVTGFLGPNGSGKSTTMRMIVGLDRPDSGTVTVDGKQYPELAWPLRSVGALLEARAIHPGRSAANHLWALAQTNDIPRSRVDEVLELVGLASVARRRVGTFSLGMGQRLGIAAALLGDPAVLLFDEPVNGLDPEGILWVRTLLKGLAGAGKTVFVSSHLMSEMALTAEQLVVVGHGRLVVQTSVAAFIAAHADYGVRVRSPQLAELAHALKESGAEVRLTDDGGATVIGIDIAEVGEVAARRSIVLHELSLQRGSLEDAFMEMTAGTVEFSGARRREPKS